MIGKCPWKLPAMSRKNATESCVLTMTDWVIWIVCALVSDIEGKWVGGQLYFFISQAEERRLELGTVSPWLVELIFANYALGKVYR